MGVERDGCGGDDGFAETGDLAAAALVDEAVQLPRRVAQQHPQVAHKLVHKPLAVHLQHAQRKLVKTRDMLQ